MKKLTIKEMSSYIGISPNYGKILGYKEVSERYRKKLRIDKTMLKGEMIEQNILDEKRANAIISGIETPEFLQGIRELALYNVNNKMKVIKMIDDALLEKGKEELKENHIKDIALLRKAYSDN